MPWEKSTLFNGEFDSVAQALIEADANYVAYSGHDSQEGFGLEDVLVRGWHNFRYDNCLYLFRALVPYHFIIVRLFNLRLENYMPYCTIVNASRFHKSSRDMSSNS